MQSLTLTEWGLTYTLLKCATAIVVALIWYHGYTQKRGA